MSDDYPTEDDLRALREAVPLMGEGARAFCERVLLHARSLWWCPEYFSRQGDDHFLVSTVGWSGNESIIGALSRNALLWLYVFEGHRRGGHYVFRLPGDSLGGRADETDAK